MVKLIKLSVLFAAMTSVMMAGNVSPALKPIGRSAGWNPQFTPSIVPIPRPKPGGN